MKVGFKAAAVELKKREQIRELLENNLVTN